MFLLGRQPAKGKKAGHMPLGYCDSKLMNALFVKELAIRWDKSIKIYSIEHKKYLGVLYLLPPQVLPNYYMVPAPI